MVIVSLFLFVPLFANANIVISEIMYNIEGSDSGREWVEICNYDSGVVDLDGWKLYEAEVNHKLNIFQGDTTLVSGECAVVADNPGKFLIDWVDFSGVIFDSSFSLKNSGESLVVRNSELIDIDSVFYNPEVGAGGDGNSLQLELGGEWIAAMPTPGEQNNIGGQKEDLPDENDSNGQTSPSGIIPSESGDVGVNWPIVSQIYANGGEGKTGVAGADIVFTGRALGLKKEPLDGARYLWNFGDGVAVDGQKVRHSYTYPADYIVWLNVSSGMYSASDKVLVKIVPNQLKISEANEEFIKLHNGLKTDLDISGWFISLGTRRSKFRFPEATFIGANSLLPISSLVSGIKITEGESVNLLYPNGSVAFSYPVGLVENSSSEVAPGTTRVQDQSEQIVLGNNSQENNIGKELQEKVAPQGGVHQPAGGEMTGGSEALKSNSESVLQGSGEANGILGTNEANLASVISITDKSKPISTKWWIALIVFIGICGGVALKFNKETEVVKIQEDSVDDYIDDIEEIT